MSAYVLVETKVNDPLAYENYNKQALGVIKHYGGRYLARGGRLEVLEGNWATPEQLVVVEFDSLEQARKFYNSPEYVAARALRQGAAEVNMLVVEGLQ